MAAQETAIVSLTSGENQIVQFRERVPEDPPEGTAIEGGPIYTSTSDMPSLEQLLEEYRVASAIFEREVLVPLRRPNRVVAATTLAATITAVGATLLVIAIASVSHPNPYISLLMFLGGLGLLATILVELRSSD